MTRLRSLGRSPTARSGWSFGTAVMCSPDHLEARGDSGYPEQFVTISADILNGHRRAAKHGEA